MIDRKIAFGSIAAVVLLAGWVQQAAAQSTPPRSTMTCPYPWCTIYVVVANNASGQPVATLQWEEVRLVRKLTGATVLWTLVGNPDYEFRADSIVATGANAAGAAAQFPLRELSSNRYGLDDLNTNDLTYTYDVRVYRKGQPGAAPLVTRGSIVNLFN